MQHLIQQLKMPGENLPGGKSSQVYEIFFSKNFRDGIFEKFDIDLRNQMEQQGITGGFFRAYNII